MKLARLFGYAMIVVSSVAFAQTTAPTASKPVTAPTPSRPTIAPKSAGTSKPASAQNPPVSNEPESTTASFGDWTLRCNYADNAGQRVKLCEVTQSLTIQGQSGPVAQIALGRVSPKDPSKLTVVLPNNVSFPSTVRFTTDDKDTSPIDLAWRRCLPGGCYADIDLKDDQLTLWKQQSDKAQLQFDDAAGRKINLPFSFRGLAQSFAALEKE